MSIQLTLSEAVSSHVWTENEVNDRLRKTTIKVIQQVTAAHQTNADLNQGVYYPHEYSNALRKSCKQERLKFFINSGYSFHGYASPKYFSMLPDKDSPSGKQSCTFVVKEGVLPSLALHKLQEGPSVLGCGEVCQLAQYRAIEEVLGTDKFDTLFASNSSTPFMISPKNPRNPISKLRNYMCDKEAGLTEVRKGDHVFFHNAHSYQAKHSLGACQGYNAICVDEGESPTFTAFGLPPTGLDHTQLQDALRAEYNDLSQDVEALISVKIMHAWQAQGWDKEEGQRLRQKQLNPKEFQAENGGKMMLVCELHTRRITDLANSSLEQARTLLDTYTVRLGKRIVLPQADNEAKRD